MTAQERRRWKKRLRLTKIRCRCGHTCWELDTRHGKPHARCEYCGEVRQLAEFPAE